MDFNTVIDIIIKDLREAGSIIDDFKNYHGVSELQVELAKSKCRSAEELIALLKKIEPGSGKTETLESKNDGVSGVSENVTPVIIHEASGQHDLFEISEEEEIEPVNVENPVTGTLKLDFSDKKTVPDKDQGDKKTTKEKVTDVNILADKFSDSSSTIFEQLSGIKKEEDIVSLLNSMPVNDLNDAIDINDKFLYIREIFKENQSSYNDAISRLNLVDNIADAKAIIMSYTDDSNENEAVIQLLDLVKRKLASDG